jgi:hypothetical protein
MAHLGNDQCGIRPGLPGCGKGLCLICTSQAGKRKHIDTSRPRCIHDVVGSGGDERRQVHIQDEDAGTRHPAQAIETRSQMKTVHGYQVRDLTTTIIKYMTGTRHPVCLQPSYTWRSVLTMLKSTVWN